MGGQGRQTNDRVTKIFHLPPSVSFAVQAGLHVSLLALFLSSPFSLHLVPCAWCKGNALNVGFLFSFIDLLGVLLHQPDMDSRCLFFF